MKSGGHCRLSLYAGTILLVVLLGSLEISAHGVRELGIAGGGSSREMAAAAGDEERYRSKIYLIFSSREMAAAAGDEERYRSKIYLIFCQKSSCEGNITCYCCLMWKSSCWLTMESCRRSCPVCNPKCHPPLPHAYHRRLPRSLAPPVDDDYSMVSSLGR